MQTLEAHVPARGIKGLRILDFTWAGAGPFATAQLALMGADVVKVETASRPDMLRVANVIFGWGEPNLESNACFNDMNAAKRSISLDLKTPAGRDTALRLASMADVVCDNMRPGKMEALGLGFETLRQGNPRLIGCSVSSIGHVDMGDEEPPDMPGYAPVFWAEGGGASVTGFPGGAPSYMRAPIDMNAAMTVALGILAAVHERQRTGLGSYIDCSAVETVAASVGDELLAASLGLPAGGLRGNDRAPYAPNEVFPCAGEDRWIAISVHTQAQWLALCSILGADALARDHKLRSRLYRWERRAELLAALGEFTRARDAHELEAALVAAGVPAAPSSPLSALLRDEDLIERGFWRTVKHPVLGEQRVGGLAWRSQMPAELSARGGPLLGEHTAQVMQEWLGLGARDIAALQAAGAFERYKVEGARKEPALASER